MEWSEHAGSEGGTSEGLWRWLSHGSGSKSKKKKKNKIFFFKRKKPVNVDQNSLKMFGINLFCYFVFVF